MNAIRIRTQIQSTTLSVPELSSMIGKTVEILVLEGDDLERDAARSSVRFAPGKGFDPALMEETFGEGFRLA